MAKEEKKETETKDEKKEADKEVVEKKEAESADKKESEKAKVAEDKKPEAESEKEEEKTSAGDADKKEEGDEEDKKSEGEDKDAGVEEKKETDSSGDGKDEAGQEKKEETPTKEGEEKEEAKEGEVGAEQPKEGEDKKTEDGEEKEGSTGKEESEAKAEIDPKKDDEKQVESTTPGKKEDEGKKKRFKFSLSGFAKKDGEDKKEVGDDGDDSQAAIANLSPEEAINKLDGAVKVLSETKSAELDREINEKIASSEADYIAFRVQKKRLLLVLGLLVGMMWVIPFIRAVEVLFFDGKPLFGGDQQEEQIPEEAMDAVEEASQSGEIKIRIRDSSGDDELVARILEQLKSADYDYVEVVDEEDSDRSGIEVVAKAEGVDLRSAVERLLQDNYDLASPSAILSEDSDFDAVIFVGEIK